jgi:hypothetical protein
VWGILRLWEHGRCQSNNLKCIPQCSFEKSTKLQLVQVVQYYWGKWNIVNVTDVLFEVNCPELTYRNSENQVTLNNYSLSGILGLHKHERFLWILCLGTEVKSLRKFTAPQSLSPMTASEISWTLYLAAMPYLKFRILTQELRKCKVINYYHYVFIRCENMEGFGFTLNLISQWGMLSLQEHGM